MDLIVAITGASGVCYGVRLLEVLKKACVSTHLIVSEVGREVLRYELALEVEDLKKYVKENYDPNNLTVGICSGSNKTDGMVVVPCSMKTLAAIANGFSYNTITRVADVMIKEKRPLILVPRETPLNGIHLRNMAHLDERGVIILPAIPGFYHHPKNIEDIVDFVVGKILDSMGLDNNLFEPYKVLKL